MLLVHASHEEAVATLRAADIDGLVGPTAPSGWTCVWVDHEDPRATEHLGFAAYLWARETPSGLAIELTHAGGGSAHHSWREGAEPFVTNGMTRALVDQFRPVGSADELRVLLTRTDLDEESLWEGLERLLDLPEIASPEPERWVVATRADPAMVRLAAAIAGPAWMVPGESGWTALAPTRDDESPGEVLAAAVSGAAKRRDRAILLWTRREAFGLQIWRAGSMDVSWSWANGWETVVSDPLEIETEVAGAIAELNPTLHRPTLRALLRRERLDSSAVASLLELLDLPGVVAKTLSARDAAEGVSGSELVPKTTPREATVSAIRADWADRKRIRNRPLYLAYAVGTALAAVVCLAMTGLGIAIWLTDGAVIDQAGVETEDRVFVGAFALLALILIPTAVYRLRRSRKSQDSE